MHGTIVLLAHPLALANGLTTNHPPVSTLWASVVADHRPKRYFHLICIFEVYALRCWVYAAHRGCTRSSALRLTVSSTGVL